MNDAIFENREAWLDVALFELNQRVFGAMLPGNIKVSCGFPPGSRGGKRPFAACPPNMSAAGNWEVFVNPTLDEPRSVLAALVGAAETVLGNVNYEATLDSFRDSVDALVDELGPYPHARILMDNRVKQPTRTYKCKCGSCGYTVRVTKRWLTLGTPQCPNNTCAHWGLDMPVHKDGKGE